MILLLMAALLSGVSMQQVPTIRVTKDPLFDGKISPLIYGEFVEFLNDLIPGMWAEKVRDRSFEGPLQPTQTWPPGQDWLAPHWKSFVCGTGKLPDWPNGDQFGMVDASADFVLDAVRPFAGSYSAQIRAHGDGGSFLAGISQEGISVKKGEKINVSAYLRADSNVHVTVMVGRQYGTFFRRYGSMTCTGLSPDWKRFSGEFLSPATDDNAMLVIAADAEGIFWTDKPSLMPSDSVHGWRKDVVAAFKAMKPGCIRFGGSSLIFYHWETGIGPRDQRAAFENKPWHNREEHDVGLHEFLGFCEAVGAEPLICLNSNAESTNSILNEIEYCNGAADTPYGKKRAANGHPEPFHVEYWQVGNEQGGKEYEDKLFAVCKAIRAKYPDLQLLSSFPSDAMLRDPAGSLDIVCPHFYEPYTQNLDNYFKRLSTDIKDHATNKKMKIGVTEWNHSAGDWGWGRSWLMTQFNAIDTARYLNMFQRLGDMIVIANRSNIVNSSAAGTVQTTPSDLFFTPAYYVKRVYGNEAGDIALKVEGGGPVDVSATRRSSDGQIALFIVNPTDSANGFLVDCRAWGPLSNGRIWSLSADSMDAVNSFAEKDRVAPKVTKLEFVNGCLVVKLAPYSVNVVMMSAAR